MSAAPGNTSNNAPQADDKNGGGKAREYVERTREMAPPEAIGTFRRTFQSSFISTFTGKPCQLQPVEHNVRPVAPEQSVAATLQTHPKVQMHPLLQRSAMSPTNASKNSLLNMLAQKHNDAVQRALEEEEETVAKQEEPENVQAFAGGADGAGTGAGDMPNDDNSQVQKSEDEAAALQRADAEDAPSVSRSSAAAAAHPNLQREISPEGEAPKDTLPTPAEAGTLRNKDDPNLVNQEAGSEGAESGSALQKTEEQAPESVSKSDDEATRDSVSPKNQYIQASGDGQQGTTALQSELNSSKGKGNPLPEGERSFFESRMGADFSGVRIHTGAQAEQMNQGLGAHAFAHGGDIYFNSGKYQPGTSQGRHLLAHELTHTVQQGGASLLKSEKRDSESEGNAIQRMGEVRASPKVGQRLCLTPGVQKTEDETAAPKIQAKCATCAAEDAAVQKSEDDSIAPQISPISRTSNSHSALNLQRMLKIGQPGDKYEQEADATADRVMRMGDDTIAPQQAKQPESVQAKLSDYEKPEHGKNANQRMNQEIDTEVPADERKAPEPGGNYEKPDPAEKRQKSNELKGPASPEVNEAAIAAPKNETLAQEGEQKIENPEELVPAEEKQPEPVDAAKVGDKLKGKLAKAKGETDELNPLQPEKPEPVVVPEPAQVTDAAGEPLPFDTHGEDQFQTAIRKAQELRDKGMTLKVKGKEGKGKAAVMKTRLTAMKGLVKESEGHVTKMDDAYKARREVVNQAKDAHKVAQEKQTKEIAELPKYEAEANKQKAESETVAADSRAIKRENEANRPDDPDDRRKAEEQGGEIEKVVNAGVTIDDAFGQAQQQATLIREKNAQAAEKNAATSAKIDQTNALLDQGDAKVVELREANAQANAEMDAKAGQPAQVKAQAKQVETTGDHLVAQSREREQELHETQAAYQADMAAIPEFNIEKEAEAYVGSGNSPQSLIQMQEDPMAQGDYASMVNVFEGTFLDPARNLTLQQRMQAVQRARERRNREVARINAAYNKPFAQYTASEKIYAGLSAKFGNFTDWLGELTFGKVAGGIAHMILDTINPLAYLRGIGGGLMKVTNGLVNAVLAVMRGDFWGFLKGVADTATGVAIVAGTITALCITISAIMTALMIFTFGAASPVAIPVLTAMGNIMAWSGPIAFWSGITALGLNMILGIKSLVDMATADSADELSAQTDDLMTDVKDGVTGGLMAIVGKAGANMAPGLVAEARALTLAAAIGGRGWLVGAMSRAALAELANLVSMRGFRQWMGGKFRKLRDWVRRGGREPIEVPGGGSAPRERPGGRAGVVAENELQGVRRVQELGNGHHLKHLDDGRVFLCSPYCTDVTEFANKYVEVIADSEMVRKKLADIAAESDPTVQTQMLNKLEDQTRLIRKRMDAQRTKALDDEIIKLDQKILRGEVQMDPADLAWLNSNPRHKQLAFDFATKKYKVQEAKIILQAESTGVIPGPARRPAGIDPDVMDGNGFGWDIKTYERGQNPSQIGQGLLDNAAKEPVLADLTGLSPTEQAQVISYVTTHKNSAHNPIRFTHL